MKEFSNGFPLACWFAKLNMLRMVSRSWTWIPLFDRLSPYFMAQTCSTFLSWPWLGPLGHLYCMICMFHGKKSKSPWCPLYIYICISIYLVPSSSAPADPGLGLLASRSRPWTLPGSWSAMPASCRRWPAATPWPLRRCWVGALAGGDGRCRGRLEAIA